MGVRADLHMQDGKVVEAWACPSRRRSDRAAVGMDYLPIDPRSSFAAQSGNDVGYIRRFAELAMRRTSRKLCNLHFGFSVRKKSGVRRARRNSIHRDHASGQLFDEHVHEYFDCCLACGIGSVCRWT